MNENQILAGKYQAKILDYGIGLTEAGNPQIMIILGFDDGQPRELTWYGSLKEGKAREITIKALLACGLKGNDIDGIADGIGGGPLDADTPVSITVEYETNQNGKSFPRVRWINRSGSALKNKMTKEEAKIKLGCLNLKGEVIAARQETGLKEPKQKDNASFNHCNEDIPF
jgi:hypothetical protein